MDTSSSNAAKQGRAINKLIKKYIDRELLAIEREALDKLPEYCEVKRNDLVSLMGTEKLNQMDKVFIDALVQVTNNEELRQYARDVDMLQAVHQATLMENKTLDTVYKWSVIGFIGLFAAATGAYLIENFFIERERKALREFDMRSGQVEACQYEVEGTVPTLKQMQACIAELDLREKVREMSR